MRQTKPAITSFARVSAIIAMMALALVLVSASISHDADGNNGVQSPASADAKTPATADDPQKQKDDSSTNAIESTPESKPVSKPKSKPDSIIDSDSKPNVKKIDKPKDEPKPDVDETEPGSVTHTFLATGAQTFIVEYDNPNSQTRSDVELAVGDQLFADFEQDTYRNWVAAGDAFGKSPMPLSRLPDDPIEVGADGAGLVDSRNIRNSKTRDQSDALTGVLISKTFVIKHRYIRLLVGGTVDRERASISLIVDGKAVKTLTGRGTGAMRVEHLNVNDYRDRKAYLKIVDKHDRGFIRVDHIVFSNLIREQKRRIGRGKVVWRYNQSVRDGWLLPDGHILLAIAKTDDESAKVIEIDRQLREHFNWKSDQNDIVSVQRLPNGNTLIAESGKSPQLLEIDPEGEIAVTVPLQAQTSNLSLQLGTARKLANGNYLVAEMFDKLVREYDADGKVVWKVELEHWPYAAIRLDNGNTLVSCTTGGKVLELDKDGKTVWELSGKDLPGVTLHDAAGLQRLANGNTIICDQDAGRKRGPKLIEVTRDKRIVWTYRDTSRIGIVNVHVTETNGKRLGSPLR